MQLHIQLVMAGRQKLHINHLRLRLQFNTDVNITTTDNQQPPHQPWRPPTVEHFIYTDTFHYS